MDGRTTGATEPRVPERLVVTFPAGVALAAPAFACLAGALRGGVALECRTLALTCLAGGSRRGVARECWTLRIGWP